MKRLPQLVSATIATGWIAAASAASATCPQNSIYCVTGTYYSTAPTFSQDCWAAYGASSGSYDLIAGRFSSGGGGSGGATAQVTVEDDYVVSGLAAGTPVTFTAHLSLSAGICNNLPFGSGSASGLLRLVGGSQSSLPFNTSSDGCSYPSGAIEVPISNQVGTPFRIHCELNAGGVQGGSGSINGTLTFIGLSGATITSCQGYRQDFVPVATRSTSWGRLKTIYR